MPVPTVRVLVIGDSPAQSRRLTRPFAAWGWGVERAPSEAGIALDRLRSEPFDLVLLDLDAAERDAYAFLRGWRAEAALNAVPVSYTHLHRHGDYWLRAGRPYPFGASIVPGGVNFAVFSRHATSCTLVLFRRGESEPLVEIPFLDAFRIGNVWAMVVFGLELEEIEYGYRMDGPHRPHAGHRFNPGIVLLDPYARAITGRTRWAEPHAAPDPAPFRGRILLDDFDWQDDRQLEIPAEDLIIYEMHVRGFTRHPSSGVKFPGTYAAIREKIPYLLELGVNAVELMPIQEFDELESDFHNPYTGQKLRNFWGYSTVGFFAPKAGYAATGALGMEADELKALVKLLHRNGIEIILDVVFNHTAEGSEKGPTLSFRGPVSYTHLDVYKRQSGPRAQQPDAGTGRAHAPGPHLPDADAAHGRDARR